ncbi:MAG TPA: ZIP family metal transporter [Anaerolineae bacterium]|nr:ZIP family metal transporter [Anaerolineae bacterium]
MLLNVFIAASITAIFTGFGAIPFFFIDDINEHWLGRGNALAAGLMLGASIGLIIEGGQIHIPRMILGVGIGFALIIGARLWLDDHNDLGVETFTQADFTKMLLIIAIMTVHSFAEGVGVGVAYGDSSNFGNVITTAIAIHNIPEGLAISLILVPRGISVWRAAGWSVFSSLPQPIMAVLAYLFVLLFEPFLPIGLGLAAGAMIWMVFRELIPESRQHLSWPALITIMTLATIAMLTFQLTIG